MHLWRHKIMTSQGRNKSVTKISKNYDFEWLSTPITFVIFSIKPWYYYWRKCMHIRRSCMNSVCSTLINIFVQYFTLKIWHTFCSVYRISAFCLSSKIEFISITIFASIIHFFSKSEQFLTHYKGEKFMTSYWWRHVLLNSHKNGPKFMLML